MYYNVGISVTTVPSKLSQQQATCRLLNSILTFPHHFILNNVPCIVVSITFDTRFRTALPSLGDGYCCNRLNINE
jgi:hypothetical protein